MSFVDYTEHARRQKSGFAVNTEHVSGQKSGFVVTTEHSRQQGKMGDHDGHGQDLAKLDRRRRLAGVIPLARVNIILYI